LRNPETSKEEVERTGNSEKITLLTEKNYRQSRDPKKRTGKSEQQDLKGT
jgi:hypothetical protein